MPEKRNFDNMTTEELEALLRQDIDAPEGQELDETALLYAVQLLASRKRNPDGSGSSAPEAYASYLRNYLYDAEDPEPAQEKQKKPRTSPFGWFRGMGAAAAVLVVLFLGALSARAFGLDILDVVVKWTGETFCFAGQGQDFREPDLTDDPYKSLEEALHAANIKEPLVPTWIPEGYELTGISIDETYKQTIYMARYKNGQKELKISVRDYLDVAPLYVEKSEGLIETYETAGVTYYIFSNLENIMAIWIKGSYECYVSGNVTVEDLKMMIDSIGAE